MSQKAFIIDLTASESDSPLTQSTTTSVVTGEQEFVDVNPTILTGRKQVRTLLASKRSAPLSQEEDVVVLKSVKPILKTPKTPPRPIVIAVSDSPRQASASNVEAKKCPICIDALSQPSATICGHVFCTSCISEAVREHHLCPICRKKLPKKNGYHAIFL